MSLISELFSTIDRGALSGIAQKLGEPEQSVSRGLQSSMAATLGGLATQSENPSALRRLLDLVPSGDLSLTNAIGAIGDPNSSLLTTGKHLLSSLFGTSEGTVTSALSTHTGLRSGVMSTLMSCAAPLVMSFLGRRVRDEGMTMGGLGNLLQRESPAIRAALPASLSDLFWPREHVAATSARPVVAQTVTREKSSSAGWLLPLFLLALVPGLIWLFNHARTVSPSTITPPRVGSASRAIPDVTPPAIPEAPKVPSLSKTLDLYFDTNSAKLKPDSAAHLKEFAAALKDNPDAHVTCDGYTDDRGDAQHNIDLSQRRANTVMGLLEKQGIPADRLTATGYGEEHPIADNGTAGGRAQNRRVSLGMTRP